MFTPCLTSVSDVLDNTFLSWKFAKQADLRTDLTVWSIYGHGSVPYTDGWFFSAPWLHQTCATMCNRNAVTDGCDVGNMNSNWMNWIDVDGSIHTMSQFIHIQYIQYLWTNHQWVNTCQYMSIPFNSYSNFYRGTSRNAAGEHIASWPISRSFYMKENGDFPNS